MIVAAFLLRGQSVPVAQSSCELELVLDQDGRCDGHEHVSYLWCEMHGGKNAHVQYVERVRCETYTLPIDWAQFRKSMLKARFDPCQHRPGSSCSFGVDDSGWAAGNAVKIIDVEDKIIPGDSFPLLLHNSLPPRKSMSSLSSTA